MRLRTFTLLNVILLALVYLISSTAISAADEDGTYVFKDTGLWTTFANPTHRYCYTATPYTNGGDLMIMMFGMDSFYLVIHSPEFAPMVPGEMYKGVFLANDSTYTSGVLTGKATDIQTLAIPDITMSTLRNLARAKSITLRNPGNLNIITRLALKGSLNAIVEMAKCYWVVNH